MKKFFRLFILLLALFFCSCAGAFNDASGFDGDKASSKKAGKDTLNIETVTTPIFYCAKYRCQDDSLLAYFGDTVFLDIALYNGRNYTANDLTVQVTCSSPFIEFKDTSNPSASAFKDYGAMSSHTYKTFSSPATYSPENLNYSTTLSGAPFVIYTSSYGNKELKIFFGVIIKEGGSEVYNKADAFSLTLKKSRLPLLFIAKTPLLTLTLPTLPFQQTATAL